MTELSADERAQLTEAAACLLAIGCSDSFATPAAVRLRCLWAVEQLSSVGAGPQRVLEPLPATGVEDTLRAALDILTALPADVATLPAVQIACQAADAALKSAR